MPRKNIMKVIELWRAGQVGKGDSKGTCSTDGTSVYSYNMRIAFRNDLGQIFVVDRKNAPSNTTRAQINTVQMAVSDWVGDKWHAGYYLIDDLSGRGGPDPDKLAECLVKHDTKEIATRAA